MVGRYFDADEFDCHDGTPYPERWVATRLGYLIETLDTIRTLWGGPLRVVSGYRTAAYNAKVGGAARSQHCEGTAADIRPRAVPGEPLADTVDRLHGLIAKLYGEGALSMLGGLGLYPGWVHVDVRTGSAHLATWQGRGIGSEVA